MALAVPRAGESGRSNPNVAVTEGGGMPACDELRLLGWSCETEPVRKDGALRAECGEPEWGD